MCMRVCAICVYVCGVCGGSCLLACGVVYVIGAWEFADKLARKQNKKRKTLKFNVAVRSAKLNSKKGKN